MRCWTPFEGPNLGFTDLLMDMTSRLYFWVGGIILGLWATRFIAYRTSNPKRLPLPPGPMGYPVVGNLFALSTDKIWLLYDKWFQLYGEGSPVCWRPVTIQTSQGTWSTLKRSVGRSSFWVLWREQTISSKNQITQVGFKTFQCSSICRLFMSLGRRMLIMILEWELDGHSRSCRMERHGGGTARHFMSTSIQTSYPNINLSNWKQPSPFFVDYWLRLMLLWIISNSMFLASAESPYTWPYMAE